MAVITYNSNSSPMSTIIGYQSQYPTPPTNNAQLNGSVTTKSGVNPIQPGALYNPIQVLGLSPLFTCCPQQTLTTPGVPGCATFSVVVNGNITTNTVTIDVTYNSLGKKTWTFGWPGGPMSCNAWIRECVNIFNTPTIFPGFKATIIGGTPSSTYGCTLQLCNIVGQTQYYGATVSIHSCIFGGGGSVVYTPPCPLSFKVGTASTTLALPLGSPGGCVDCEGKYAADGDLSDMDIFQLPVFAQSQNCCTFVVTPTGSGAGGTTFVQATGFLDIAVANTFGTNTADQIAVKIAAGVNNDVNKQGFTAATQSGGIVTICHPGNPNTTISIPNSGPAFTTNPTTCSMGSGNPTENDESSWLIYYPPGYDAVGSNNFTLEQYSCTQSQWNKVAILNNYQYGIPYNNNMTGIAGAFPFLSCDGITILPYNPTNNYQGFRLDWGAVMASFGVGTYRFRASGTIIGSTPYCFVSNPFYLQIATCISMDDTVRLETTICGGRQGDINTQGQIWNFDLPSTSLSTALGIQWYDQIRFQGMMGYKINEITREQIQYQNGIIEKVRDEDIKTYTLKTALVPMWCMDRLMYAFMSDKLLVTDYNLANPDYLTQQKWLVCDSGVKPIYTDGTRLVYVSDVTFKEGQQSIFRDRC